MNYRVRWCLVLCATLGVFCWIGIAQSQAAIYFEENFDGSQWTGSNSTWAQCPPSPWCTSCGCNGSIETATVGGVTHSPYEITSPGRGGSGKSLKAWRSGGLWPGYSGLAMRSIPGSITTPVLYMRFYMKIPTEMSFVGITNYQKMYRFNLNPSGEFYVNIQPGPKISFCPNSGGSDCWAATLAPWATVHDGQWHSHEIMIDIPNTTVKYWLDGVETYSKTTVNMNGISTSAVFGGGSNFIQHFPLGNRDGTYQSSWQALEVDDFAIGNTYIGPIGGGGDTTPPSIPTTLTATAQSATSITLTWAASTDNVGIAGYDIRRCSGSGCTPSSIVHNTTGTGTTWNNTGLSASTIYRYDVRARDAVPNYSSYSTIAQATTQSPPDTTPPNTIIITTGPTKIHISSLTVTGTSSDAVGVSGCKWRRSLAPNASNGTLCTGTTSFSCATSGYLQGANTLYVGCYDAAGNYGIDSMVVNYYPPLSAPTNLRIY
jgi:hypothetical protein